jgi:hypothetical protein
MAKEKDASEEVSEGASQRRKDFQRIIDAYKAQNPAKYELKKAELEKKLAAIK